MPACEPWCPIVRTELRKIVTQAPWIRDEKLESFSVKVREAAPSHKPDGEKLLTESVDGKWGDRKRRAAAGELYDGQHHPESYSHQDPESWLDVMDAVDVKSAKESREILSHGQTVLERKAKSATHSTQSVGTFTSKAVDSAVSATAVGPRAGDSLVSATAVRSRADDSLASSVSRAGDSLVSGVSRADDSLVSSASRAAMSTKGTVTGDTAGLASDKVVETDSAIGLSRRPDRMDREAIAEGRERAIVEGREGAIAEGREGAIAEGREGAIAEGREGAIAEGREGAIAEGREEAIAEGRGEDIGEGREEDIGEGREEAIGERRDGPAIFPDECEPTCPRRISRENRIRKLEERQSTVDAYLLNKGTNYFDDVCTCSLSCVVRALKDDSFIRSIIASAALFALGLKLCMELDSWYLPVRLS